MMPFFSPHAVDRAWERYGVAYSSNDMREILRACHDGRATRMQTTTAGGVVFVWRYQGKVILPVILNGGFIVTFQPGDYFTAGVSRRHNQTKTTASAAKYARVETYRRAKSKRQARQAVQEEV